MSGPLDWEKPGKLHGMLKRFKSNRKQIGRGTACEECRRLKKRCDEKRPCSACILKGCENKCVGSEAGEGQKGQAGASEDEEKPVLSPGGSQPVISPGGSASTVSDHTSLRTPLGSAHRAPDTSAWAMPAMQSVGSSLSSSEQLVLSPSGSQPMISPGGSASTVSDHASLPMPLGSVHGAPVTSAWAMPAMQSTGLTLPAQLIELKPLAQPLLPLAGTLTASPSYMGGLPLAGMPQSSSPHIGGSGQDMERAPERGPSSGSFAASPCGGSSRESSSVPFISATAEEPICQELHLGRKWLRRFTDLGFDHAEICDMIRHLPPKLSAAVARLDDRVEAMAAAQHALEGDSGASDSRVPAWEEAQRCASLVCTLNADGTTNAIRVNAVAKALFAGPVGSFDVVSRGMARGRIPLPSSQYRYLCIRMHISWMFLTRRQAGHIFCCGNIGKKDMCFRLFVRFFQGYTATCNVLIAAEEYDAAVRASPDANGIFLECFRTASEFFRTREQTVTGERIENMMATVEGEGVLNRFADKINTMLDALPPVDAPPLAR